MKQKILVVSKNVATGVKIKNTFESMGHSVALYKSNEDIRKIYSHIPLYDVAVIDNIITSYSRREKPHIIDNNDLVARLKNVNPGKKLFI